MPLEQTITIVNNSGNIISTGRQLVSLFKDAKASYHEKKAEIRALKRAETLDHPSSTTRRRDGHHAHRPRTLARHATHEPEHYTEYDCGRDPDDQEGGSRRRRLRSHDAHSEASSRHPSRAAAKQQQRELEGKEGRGSRPPLTASNLRTLSEISSTAPSQRAPPRRAYRSPYAETLPKDSRISWMNLTQCDTRIADAPAAWRTQSSLVPRRRLSEPDMAGRPPSAGKEIDMHLAYGDVPPDLAERVDLDFEATGEEDETLAKQLVRRVEHLLDEAHCLQHSASSIIKHLQERPDAAAAVALTLAELSSVVGKMTPSFVGFLKGASPAVFSLLASPQFLIGSSIAVGLTVVMFGGWKIIKRVHEQQQQQQQQQKLLLRPSSSSAPGNRGALAWPETTRGDRPALRRCQSEAPTHAGQGIDEALIVDDDLSTIETWRRGILPPGADNESAEIELITPRAERARRDNRLGGGDDLDACSRGSARTAKTAKTVKTARSSKTEKSSKTVKTEKSSGRSKEKEREREREREGQKQGPSRRATAESIAGDSDLSTARRRRRLRGVDAEEDKARPGMRMIEDRRRSTPEMELISRPKAESQGENMLKALFRGKEGGRRGGSGTGVVVV